jgi:hypothetical protein
MHESSQTGETGVLAEPEPGEARESCVEALCDSAPRRSCASLEREAKLGQTGWHEWVFVETAVRL